MNRLRLGWLIIEGILLAFFLYLGSSTALAAAILLILIPVCSLLINMYVRKFISLNFLTQSSVRKGENGTVSVSIENGSKFPVLRACCKVQIENQLNKQTSRKDFHMWLPAKKKQEFSLNVGSEYCGRIRFTMPYIILYDCFGMIGIRKPLETKGYMTVLPDTYEMEVQLLSMPGSIEESEIYSQERPGNDLSEIFQIREYVPGDSPKQIHWKLSGKFDRLIVRDASLPITKNVLLFWERTGESGDFAVIDAQAETLITICQKLLEQSIQFTLGWNDTNVNQCVLQEIHDMDELIGMIPRILCAAGCKEGISGAELLLHTNQQALCTHMIYLAEEAQSHELQQYGHLSMLLCGKNSLEGALMFDAKHYKEQLTQIEL